jgi:hypothetical protein
VDLTRSTLYILLPLSLMLLALVLVSQGVVQTFAPYRSVELLPPVHHRERDGCRRGRGGHQMQVTVWPLGAGRVADRDQAARHQWRRLLQRQLGASAGEPDAAVELPRDAGHPADPGGALLHLRRMVGDTRQGWAMLAP